jgi:hypothetical protein
MSLYYKMYYNHTKIKFEIESTIIKYKINYFLVKLFNA